MKKVFFKKILFYLHHNGAFCKGLRLGHLGVLILAPYNLHLHRCFFKIMRKYLTLSLDLGQELTFQYPTKFFWFNSMFEWVKSEKNSKRGLRLGHVTLHTKMHGRDA